MKLVKKKIKIRKKALDELHERTGASISTLYYALRYQSYSDEAVALREMAMNEYKGTLVTEELPETQSERRKIAMA